MKVIECKAVHEWDGGDRTNFGFYIAADVPDDEILKMRPNCHIQKTTLVVFDSFEELAANAAHKLRKQVWDKLTPPERQAIGMKDPT